MHGIFRWFWTKVYDGVKLNFFDEFRSLTTEKEIIYTPCHRSHIDYLILSYSLYEKGIVPPHIAAGINLNLPFCGPNFARFRGLFLAPFVQLGFVFNHFL